MSSDKKGDFSANFDIMQLQFRTLFEGFGGEYAIRLLDAIAQFGQLEQNILLNTFTNILNRIHASEQHVPSDTEKSASELEEAIYREIMQAMHAASSGAPRLEVLSGGADEKPLRNAPIDLAKARDIKRAKNKPVIN